MNLKKIETDDGSITFLNEKLGETYHSTAGAFQESFHIYIKNGLWNMPKKKLTIFEMGFGLGYNMFLTLLQAIEKDFQIDYYSIDNQVISLDLIKEIQLPLPFAENRELFVFLHEQPWNKKIEVNKNFSFTKILSDFKNYKFNFTFDLCYYDAFSYNSQPELWSEEIFRKIYNAMNFNGLLLTYASKGIIKQNLRKVGFFVKRFKGIGNKRHNLIAKKILEK